MTAKLIDGVAVAKKVREDIKTRVVRLNTLGIVPGLAVIIVGENPASKVYVRKKISACAEVGVRSEVHEFPSDADQGSVLARIAALNINPDIHGMIVQLPLPSHLDMRRVLEAIARDKDVDGFHLYNVGGLVIGNTVFPPCTPMGVQLLLEYAGI
ncbi:MAG: tetrahydrofolate dehydrogenase/cyclohydrolase catalytic domain-containing protein, partial [Burkholderiales bacterium]